MVFGTRSQVTGQFGLTFWQGSRVISLDWWPGTYWTITPKFSHMRFIFNSEIQMRYIPYITYYIHAYIITTRAHSDKNEIFPITSLETWLNIKFRKLIFYQRMQVSRRVQGTFGSPDHGANWFPGVICGVNIQLRRAHNLDYVMSFASHWLYLLRLSRAIATGAQR